MKRIAAYCLMLLLACAPLQGAENARDLVKRFFPNVELVRSPPNGLWVIAHYLEERKLKPLPQGCMRFYMQPDGIVNDAMQVDLGSGALISFPGTHSKDPVFHAQLTSEQLSELRALLDSPRFRELPLESGYAGADGFSYVVEAELDGVYYCKSHQFPDAKVLFEIAEFMESAAKSAAPATADSIQP